MTRLSHTLRRLLLATALSLLVASCSKREDTNSVPVRLAQSEAAAWGGAVAEANQSGGLVYRVLPTGSMRPAIQDGDFAVCVKKPFSDVKVGDVVNYTPEWAVRQIGVGRYVIARATGQTGKIVSGDDASWLVDFGSHVEAVAKDAAIPPPVMHRLVAKDSYGFIASGDNNAHSESGERVTEKNYLNALVAIHRAKHE